MLDLLKNGEREYLNSVIKTWRARIEPRGRRQRDKRGVGGGGNIPRERRRRGCERTGGGEVRVPSEKTGSTGAWRLEAGGVR
jgi:hypothetical protein